MKTKTLILLSILLIVYSCADLDKNSFSKNKINGDIRLITETKYKAVEKFGKIQNGHLINIQIFKYNDIRNLSEFDDYQLNGDIEYKSSYTYDNEGTMIENSSYCSNGDLISKSIVKYNDKLNQVDEFFYNTSGDVEFMLRFIYNDNDEITELLTFESDGEFDYKIQYEYDENGNLKQESHYDKNGVPIVSKDFKYDESNTENNWTSRVMYIDNKPKQLTKRVIEYY